MWDFLYNEAFVISAMSVVIFLATQLIKTPIKYATKHIKNERVRRLCNMTILLIPFALGVVFDYLYATYVLHTVASVIIGLGYGAGGVSLYAAVERFFKVKIDNPYDSEEGKAVMELYNEVTEDNKIDKDDQNKVQEFWNKVK